MVKKLAGSILVLLGIVMILLGVNANILPPTVTGIGFMLIALVFLSEKSVP